LAKRNRRPVVAADIHGSAVHTLDGNWGRSRTIFDSELYKVLLEVIEDALSHAADPIRHTRVVIGIAELKVAAGLSELQSQILEKTADGHSQRAIAAEHGISRRSVRTHLERAKAKAVVAHAASRQ